MLLIVGCSSPFDPMIDGRPLPASLAPSAAAATSNQLSLHFIRSNECTGEDVEITGTIHLVAQTRPDGGIMGHFNYQNVTGTGLTTGTRYRVSAVDHVQLAPPFPSSVHSVRSFRMIAPGPDDDLIVHALTHITVTANGDVSVSIDELNSRCVGG
jgi:hypothetical protein